MNITPVTNENLFQKNETNLWMEDGGINWKKEMDKVQFI